MMKQPKGPIKTKKTMESTARAKDKKHNWWRETPDVLAKFLGPAEIERLFTKDYDHISIEPMYYAVFIKNGRVEGAISQETLELGRGLERKVRDYTAKRLSPDGFREKLIYNFRKLFKMGPERSAKEILERAKLEMKKKHQEVSLIMVDSTPRDLQFVPKETHQIFMRSDDPDLHVAGDLLRGKIKFTVRMDHNNVPRIINAMKGREVLTFTGLKKDLSFHMLEFLQEFFREHTPMEVFHENRKIREHLMTDLVNQFNARLDTYGLNITGLAAVFKPPRAVLRHGKIDEMTIRIRDIGIKDAKIVAAKKEAQRMQERAMAEARHRTEEDIIEDQRKNRRLELIRREGELEDEFDRNAVEFRGKKKILMTKKEGIDVRKVGVVLDEKEIHVRDREIGIKEKQLDQDLTERGIGLEADRTRAAQTREHKEKLREDKISAKKRFVEHQREWMRLSDEEKRIKIEGERLADDRELMRLENKIDKKLTRIKEIHNAKRQKKLLDAIDKHKLRDEFNELKLDLYQNKLKRMEEKGLANLKYISALENMKIEAEIEKIGSEKELDHAKMEKIKERMRDKVEHDELKFSLIEGKLDQYANIKKTFEDYYEKIDELMKDRDEILILYKEEIIEEYDEHKARSDQDFSDLLNQF